MVKVIGGGLAGVEAVCFLAKKGMEVELVEMKPKKFSPAHKSPNFGELVCSNSLKSDDKDFNACGLLKEELRLLGSATMEAAEKTRVPAGGALAVDREAFSEYLTRKVRSFQNVHVTIKEETSLPEEGIVATGPLTSEALSKAIEERFCGLLHFFDASAPVVSSESVDFSKTFLQDRYDRGTGDYVNCPMTKEEYLLFVEELLKAERATLHAFEKREIFEGCMPIEVMASRGIDTLRFGTFKPVGLSFGAVRPYAVLQLRKENKEGTSLGLVGCQTNLKFYEQKRVFSLIPALKNAEFERYGVMHRNTYLDSPKVLNSDFSVKTSPKLFFAGQITGVEGYVESAMSGLLAAIGYYLKEKGKKLNLSENTMCGALSNYVAAKNPYFSPMNANYGLLAAIDAKDKTLKRKLFSERALREIQSFRESIE